MSSGGSLSTMQRLVEQLKLEAAVERIKDECPGEEPGEELEDNEQESSKIANKSVSLRQLQNSSSTVCKMLAKMPCLLGFPQGAIPSVNPDPVLCSEISTKSNGSREELRQSVVTSFITFFSIDLKDELLPELCLYPCNTCRVGEVIGELPSSIT
ncbi:hypothetical protein DV515_00012187 [Chloebia gouldiae]|uniref:G protein gamma domain-containing protein n=1 Tax=Chloebia gouldiae TaxID=44316 RepID=A0A3L8S5G2_CHLGU|nr:hypothetical protein DV515_00012187 [Chloebia gouldiae]